MLSLMFFQQPPNGIQQPASYLPGVGGSTQIPPIPLSPNGYIDNLYPIFQMVRGSDTAWVRGRTISFDIVFAENYPPTGFPVSMRTLGFTYVDHVSFKDNSVGTLGAPSGHWFEWDGYHKSIRIFNCGASGQAGTEIPVGANASAVTCRATFYGGM